MSIEYKLDDLGWFEFEQLIQALIKAQLGMGVEAWGGSGDWGRDAYYDGQLKYPSTELTAGPFAFQAKFVSCANAAGARSQKDIVGAVRKEMVRIGIQLQSGRWSMPPKCYTMLTNAPVGAVLRIQVKAMLNEVLPHSEIVVQDGGDICKMLRQSPEIVRTFPQILSIRDLQTLLQEAVHSDVIIRSHTAIALAQSHARVFVPTAAYEAARAKLAKHHFVVLEGPPEMGKTTIGRIIALSQIISGWEAIECRSPTDVLKIYRRERRQVFIADDFFGRTEYEPMRVSDWQSELAHILPLLDRWHWLILTCRAHLLEMAKSNLDIAGQNSRFPHLGEVVVNAGNLTSSEKARMLYRHAKALDLGDLAKALIRRHARLITLHSHFTPERIRRLVEELVPELATKIELSEHEIKTRLADALANPTRQMRISFRGLSASHRWLIFAMLEVDRTENVIIELNRRYDALCPFDAHRPFRKVMDELTEAFLTIRRNLFGQSLDWVHPSCRDLAIDELSERSEDRQHFLGHCTEKGIVLALSVAGGAEGDRQLPLMQTDGDWRCLSEYALHLVKVDPHVLVAIWNSYKSLLRQDRTKPSIDKAVTQLEVLMKEKLCDAAGSRLSVVGYTQLSSLQMYSNICKGLSVTPTVEFTQIWTACVEDVTLWASDRDDAIWAADEVPKRVSELLRILLSFGFDFFNDPEVEGQVRLLHRSFQERMEAEQRTLYSPPEDEEEIESRASGFEEMSETFGTLASIDVWSSSQKRMLEGFAEDFSLKAESLREDISPEQDEDSEFRSSASEEVNIEDLFRDL